MDILLIGNGFDLAHGLPTRYENFLDFVQNPTPYIDQVKEYVPSKSWQAQIIHACSEDQSWFNALKSGCAQLCKCLQQEKDLHLWVDFESEIQKIVELIVDRANRPTFIHPVLTFYTTLDLDQSLLSLEGHIHNLLNLMMVYYGTIVPFIPIKQYPAWLYEKAFSHLITFNYTDTFRRVVNQLGIKTFPKSENCQFIHGTIGSQDNQIDCQHPESLHNMVLGFTSQNPDNLRTVRFQKYFQRIQKRTGIQYRNWVVRNNPYDSTLTIMGHSCDPTDGDALRHLVVNTDETNVYYFDQADYERKITNFIALFGADTFQEYYYSEKIKFIKQPASVPFPPNT